MYDMGICFNLSIEISQLIGNAPQVRAFALPPDSNICITSIHKRILFSNRAGIDARLRKMFHIKDDGMSSKHGCFIR